MNKELESIVEELGGEISHHLDEATTHYVFQVGKGDYAQTRANYFKHLPEAIFESLFVCFCVNIIEVYV